jgi:hypothetical protein
MGGITFRYAGVDWIQGDAVMADTGCDIMLITVSMAKGMKLPIVPSNTIVHTSVSGQSSVLGEVADNFDVVLCKGTSDELVVHVGRDTKVKVMVAPDDSIYVVLLCQKFHHACGGYNDPEVNPVHPTPVVDVEDIIPNPSLLDDGDVEPHPGPVNLSQFGEQPTSQMGCIPWIKQHIPRRDGPEGWFKHFCHKLPDMSERNNVVHKRGQAILNPRVQWNHEIVRFPRTASVESHRIGIRFTAKGEKTSSSTSTSVYCTTNQILPPSR